MEEEEADEIVSFSTNPSIVRRDFPVGGMELVVASVSGYHGLEKFKLIKLINQSGASYVGTMTKSVTHLVCWKFEGRKYSLAKDFGTKIVNHRWFEDCLKEGKRLLEEPYLMKSGQQVGPLSWEIPVVVETSARKGNLLTRKDKKVLVDLTNTFNDYNASEIDTTTRCFSAGCSTWSDSHLLREPMELSSYSSMLSARKKRNIHIADENYASTKSTCKGRRLVKKNAPDASKNSAELEDNTQECCPFDLFNELNNVGSVCQSSRTTLQNEFLNSGEHRNRELEDEEIAELNKMSVCNDSDKPVSDRSPSTQETTSQNECHNTIGNQNGVVKEVDHLEEQIVLPTSSDLSCVICWTDFSSTRGVLPCGHRFCYSCIQGWAVHMISMRKVSACPLCKASFEIIRKVEGAAPFDQKIYSQTLPCTSTEDILVLPGREPCYSLTNEHSARVCYECRSHEPEDLLVSCHICRNQWVHSFCLDPPLVPWTCIHCKDNRRLYQRFW
ncbi:hypothetical protein AAC387_Pa07g2311 [Persea americana]